MKAKVTDTSVAVATTKFLSGICDCTVDSDVDTGDFSFLFGNFARAWTLVHAIARLSEHGLHIQRSCYFHEFKGMFFAFLP